jgi:phosphate transport system protein
MKRFFDSELEAFRSHLLQMGERSIDLTRQAMQALTTSDIALADKVIAADDEIDKLEVQIDDEAIRYMTLRGPVASELRLIIVGMKASHDLERVGDEATSICRRARKLAIEPKLELYADPAWWRSRWRCCAMRWIVLCRRTNRRRST